MGLFHCPIGAEGYLGEGCIQCGLCKATNVAEKYEATVKIRAWIKENNYEKNPELKIKKIAVCGKGGSGKSTLTALISACLDRYGYQIVVLDTDTANAGLWRKIGVTEKPRVISVVTDEDEEEVEMLADPEFFKRDPLYFEEIDEEYIRWNESRGIIISGKIEDPLIGCACPLTARAKRLMNNMVPRNREIVIVDQEAGVENFGRGFEQCCDTILIPVEPSSESVELAEKVQYMAEGLGIRRVRAVINKCEDEEMEYMLRDILSKKGIRYLGTIPRSKEIAKANLMGEEITPDMAMPLAGNIVKWMLDEAQMSYDK